MVLFFGPDLKRSLLLTRNTLAPKDTVHQINFCSLALKDKSAIIPDDCRKGTMSDQLYETLEQQGSVDKNVEGILEFDGKVLSEPEPGERTRSRGRKVPIYTFRVLTTKGEIATVRQGTFEIPAPDTNVHIKGRGRRDAWKAERSGKTGHNIFISDLLKIEPVQLDEKVFTFHVTSDFVRQVGAPVTTPSID